MRAQRWWRREAGLGPLVVILVVAVVAVGVTVGKTMWDDYQSSDAPGADAARDLLGGVVNPTATPYIGEITFTETGSIPYEGGTRTATVVTRYTAGEQYGSPTSVVTQTVDVLEQFPAPLNPPPDFCYTKTSHEVGTISGQADVQISRNSDGTLTITAGDYAGGAGPIRTNTFSGPGCKTLTESVEGLRATGPWLYRGPGGNGGPSGLEASGSGLSSSARWLDAGKTTVSFDIATF